MPGGWADFVTGQLPPEYAPGLPDAAPKPPGYWAADALRQGPITTAGIPFGMLGSAMQAYTENVPQRIGSGIGQVLATLPAPDAAVNTMAGMPAITPVPGVTLPIRWLGGLAQAARQNPQVGFGNPEIFQKAVKNIGAGPIEEMAMTAGADPMTYASFGEAPLASAGFKGLSGLAHAMNEIQAIPFRAAASGATRAVQGAGRAIEMGGNAIGRQFPNAPLALQKPLEQAPASSAAQVIRKLTDVIAQAPDYFKSLNTPLEGVGRYDMPTFNNGMPDIAKANQELATRYQDIERRILNPFSVEDTLRNLHAYEEMQLVRSNTHASLMPDLMNDLKSPDPKVVQAAIGGFNGWYDNSMRQLDAAAQMFKRPNGTPVAPVMGTAGTVVNPGTGPGVANLLSQTQGRDLQDILEQYMAKVGQTHADTRAQVNFMRSGGPNGLPTVTGSLLKPLVNDLYSQRNESLIHHVQDATNDIINQFGVTPERAAELRTMVNNEFRDRMASLRAQSVGGPIGSVFTASSEHRNALDQLSGVFVPQIQRIVGQQHQVAKQLAEALRVQGPGNFSAVQASSMGEMWRQIQAKLQVAGMQPLPALGTATSDQLMTALSGLVREQLAEPNAVNRIANILGPWKNRGDLLIGSPLQMALAPTQNIFERSLSGSSAIDQQGLLGKMYSGLDLFHQMLKESWLATPGYHEANGLSALGINFFESPKAALGMLQNLREMFPRYQYGRLNPGSMSDLDLIPKDIANDFRTWGFNAVPADFSVGGHISGNMQAMSESRTAMERAKWWQRMGFFAATAPINPVGAAAQIVGGTLAGPAISRFSRNVGQLVESGARLALGHTAMAQQVDAGFPRFVKDLGFLVATKGQEARASAGGHIIFDPATGLPVTMAHTLTPFTTQATRPNWTPIKAWLDATGPHFSPQELMQHMQDAGVHSSVAQEAGQKWNQYLYDALKTGTDLSNQRHVDYSQFSNLEAALDKLAPFTRWAIHMAPNFRDIMAESPGFVMAMQRLNGITSKEADELGLSDRYKRMIDTGSLGQGVAQMLFGQQGGKVFVDPARVLMPWTNVQASAQSARFSASPVEAAVDLMPWKPYPELQALAQVLSSNIGSHMPQLQPFLPYSPESSIPGLSRTSGLAGLMGGDPREIQQQFLSGMPGANPYDYFRSGVQQRLGEDATVQTGHPDHPVFQAAQGLENGPQYEDAKRRVAQEKALEQALSMFLPMGVAAVGQPEINANVAARNLPTGTRETPEKQQAYNQALQQNPWAAAHQGIQGSPLSSRVQYAFNVMRNPALLFPTADPSVAARLSQHLMEYDNARSYSEQNSLKFSDPLISAALSARQDFMSKVPEAKAYMYWRQQLHPQQRTADEAAMMQQFIQWYQGGNRPPADWQG